LAGVVYIHSSDVAPTTFANTLGIPTTRTGPDGYSQEEFDELLNDPANRQQHGDTTYITIPTRQLPILQPLRDFGAFTGTTSVTKPIADLIEPALRVLIETGYDRTASYGQPVMAGLIPALNPVKLAADLAAAAGQGAAQALHDLGLAPQAPATSATTSTDRDEKTVDPSTKRVEVTKPKADVPETGNDTDENQTHIKRRGIQIMKSTDVTKSDDGAEVAGTPGSKPHNAAPDAASAPSKATGSQGRTGVSVAPSAKPHNAAPDAASAPSKATGSGAGSSKPHSSDRGGAPSKKAGRTLHPSTPAGHRSHPHTERHGK
jgi:hypothetical protein